MPKNTHPERPFFANVYSSSSGYYYYYDDDDGDRPVWSTEPQT
jgi:hypothetical protein